MSVLVVVDNPKRWPLHIPGVETVLSRDYLAEPRFTTLRSAKVFNLCRSYRYQSTGYYVSLLAAARGHRVLPSIATIQDLKLAPVIRIAAAELDDLMQHSLKQLKGDTFELSIYFGRNMAARYERLSMALFNQFPAPFLRASFVREDGHWDLESIRPIAGNDVPESHQPFLTEQAQRYFSARPRRSRARRTYKYDLAILVDPEETMPPSNGKALRKFARAAEQLGISTATIEKDAYGHIAEYDALFIRVTTAVNHYSYRFSRRAAAEGLVVIDSPEAIVRCVNKVYLAELLERHNISRPRTLIISKETVQQAPEQLGYPFVLKQPDSAFSQGVVKVENEGELLAQTAGRFEQSDLLLAQEFCPTEYDWRVGVLDGRPLYVCRYHMARRHWQIIDSSGRQTRYGQVDTMAVEEAPIDVVALGVRAAGLMGEGLFGVDIKVVNERPIVIEVNDNPSIDAGYEDRVLKDDLYMAVMRSFLSKLESRRG